MFISDEINIFPLSVQKMTDQRRSNSPRAFVSLETVYKIKEKYSYHITVLCSTISYQLLYITNYLNI